MTETDFSAWQSRPRRGGVQPFAALAALPSLPPQTDAEREAMQAAREASSTALIAKGNADRFAAICPPSLHPDRTDWAHPGLASTLAQCAKVRAWTPTVDQHGRVRGILASGPTYRGKSRAMWALMHRLQVTEGRRVSFFTAADFFAKLNEQVSYGRDDARLWVDGVARLPLLFIDDLGQEAVIASRAEWARQWFFALLDTRRAHSLPLFATTNLPSTQMAQDRASVNGDPLITRLLDVCEPVKF